MVHARLVGASILSLTLLLGACGGDDDDDAATEDDTEEATTTTEEAEEEEETTTTTAAGGGEEASGAVTVQTAETALGTILVDGDGNTLYGFTVDTAGTPTCSGGCASAWPALTVESEPVLGPGLDPAVFTTVAGVDGGLQLKAGQWPLYRFASDAAPGDTSGQGSGGVWFVVRPDGTLLEE